MFKKMTLAALMISTVAALSVAGCRVRVESDIPAGQGQICFDVQPASASVYIDGQHVGMANQGCVQVSPGRHEVTISKKNMDTYHGIVDVAPGTSATVDVKLNKGRNPGKGRGPR